MRTGLITPLPPLGAASGGTTPSLDPLVVERELRSLLAGVRLVGELDLDPAGDVYIGARAVVEECLDRRYGLDRIARLYPASLATFLVAEGRERYDGGYYQHLTLPLDEGSIGPAFARSLDALGLEGFPWVNPEGAYKWVAKILLHGGLPRFCAGDVLARLSTELRRGAVDAAEIVASWSADPDRLVGVDRPGQRFVLEGGDVAVDLLDRVIDLASVPPGGDIDPGALGLPSYLVEEWLKLDLARTMRTARARLQAPRVTFDPWSCEGPSLELPAVPQDRGRCTWFLHVEPVRRLPASRAAATSTSLLPGSRWRIELVEGEHVHGAYTLGGVRGVNALLFDPDTGVLLRDQERLRIERVLVLHSGSVHVGSEGGNAADIEELPPLDGRWSSWTARHLRLEIGTRLSFRGEGVTSVVPCLGAGLRPTVVGSPVAHVRAADGRPVYAAAPGVKLDTVSVPPDRWRIEVSDESNGSSCTGTARDLVDTDGSLASLGVAGLFNGSVAVRGPLGADLRRTPFAVVPGLTVEVADRLLAPDEAVEVTATAAPGIVIRAADGGPLIAAAGADEVQATATDRHGSVDFVIVVPRVQWALRGAAVPLGPLASTVVDVTVEDLVAGDIDALLVRTRRPTTMDLVLTDGERDRQIVGPVSTGGVDQRWAFALRAITDTVKSTDTALLRLELRAGTLRVPVARIHARYEVSQIDVESVVEGPGAHTLLHIEFRENRRFTAREARLWSVTRPWHAVERLPIPDEADGCLEVLCEPGRLPAGQYLVEIAVRDQWTTPRRPRPSSSQVARLDIGSSSDEQDYLRSLDAKDPLSALELSIVRPQDARTRSIRTDELPSVLPSVLPALVATIDAGSAPAISHRTFAVLRDVALEEPDALASALRRVIGDGVFGVEQADRLALGLLPDLVDCPLVDADDESREAVHRLAPIAAAALDRPVLSDPESVRRWLVHTGWRPSLEHLPPAGGPVKPHMLAWTTERIDELRVALNACDHRPLSKDGMPLAMFSLLQHRSHHGETAIASWRSRFGRLYDARVRRLSARHAEVLRSIAPVAKESEAVGRFLPEVQAAAFHLVSLPGERVAATEALLSAYDFVPALVRRSAIVAVILHRARG